MIPVAQQPEPPNFEVRVRTPGRAFLRRNPRPTRDNFKNKRFWKHCLSDLKHAYSEICAYSACWVCTDGTVDHFWPVTEKPELAYEWNNYRLALSKFNSYKDNKTDVLDPFQIQEGWFVLNFKNFYVEPNVGLATEVETAVKRTIEIFHLNKDEGLVQFRFSIVRDYARGDISLEFLMRRYPFIGKELERQNLMESIKTYFR